MKVKVIESLGQKANKNKRVGENKIVTEIRSEIDALLDRQFVIRNKLNSLYELKYKNLERQKRDVLALNEELENNCLSVRLLHLMLAHNLLDFEGQAGPSMFLT